MQYLIDFILFFAKTFVLVTAILLVIAGIFAIANKGKVKEKIKIIKLNKKFEDMRNKLREEVLAKAELKTQAKQEKQEKKLAKKNKKAEPTRRKIFLINFQGDIRANQANILREQITAILTIAEPQDEVVVNLESPGGVVHGYGLCASQLKRIRTRNIPLTIIIDRVAASGGYMMACVSNKIIAAPFAIIGSIGVIAQLPNFNKLLKHHHIDFEQLTAGEYKRTLTIFGENTPKAREKMQEELEEIHVLFKDFIKENRPKLDVETVATGEHWLGTKALELNLIDEINTSDDYLLDASKNADIFEIRIYQKKGLMEKLSKGVEMTLDKFFTTWH